MDFIYARQSADKKDSISIETQIEKCLSESSGEYKVFCDKGYSGKNFNRPEFKAMLNEVKNGSAEKIIVYRIDRLSRSISDFSYFWNILEKNNVGFVSVNEKFDTSQPIGKAMLYIIMSFAQLERETIAERIRDNYYARFKRGIWSGGKPPLGFDIKQRVFDGKKESVIVPNKDIEIIKFIFDTYSKGESLGETARQAENKFPDIKHYWDNKSVSRIIRNPVYARCGKDTYDYYFNKDTKIIGERKEFSGRGALLLGKEEDLKEKMLVQSFHEGIIKEDIFIKCNKRLDKNSKINNFSKSKYSFLTGTLKCGVCQKNIKVIYSNGKKYFFCSKGCARKSNFNIEDVEGEVIKKAENLVKKYFGLIKTEKRNITELKIRKLMLLAEEGKITGEDIQKSIGEIKNSKRKEMNFTSVYDLTYNEKRIFFKLLIEKIKIFDEEINIFYRL